MKIDEDRKNVLTKFVKTKGKSNKIESNHNPMILEVNMSWSSKGVIERTEIYNLKNKSCQENFYSFTNNSDMLTNCLINKDVRTGGKLWMKHLKFAIMQNFRKIRMNDMKQGKANREIEILLAKRKLEDGIDRSITEDELANKIYERNRQIIIDQVANMTDTSCNLTRMKVEN